MKSNIMIQMANSYRKINTSIGRGVGTCKYHSAVVARNIERTHLHYRLICHWYFSAHFMHMKDVLISQDFNYACMLHTSCPRLDFPQPTVLQCVTILIPYMQTCWQWFWWWWTSGFSWGYQKLQRAPKSQVSHTLFGDSNQVWGRRQLHTTSTISVAARLHSRVLYARA